MTDFMEQQENRILPIKIRKDLTIHIQDLPFDMTEAEAKKIANVILALASEDREKPGLR
jgi:hypothetical protein